MTKVEEKRISFHLLECCSNVAVSSPKLLASVIILDDLTVSAFKYEILVPGNVYQHLLHDKYVKSYFELSNLLAHCKSLVDKSTSHNADFIDLAISALQDYITMQTINCGQIVNVALLHFIIKQLQLLFKTKEGRRFSTTLITIAFLY